MVTMCLQAKISRNYENKSVKARTQMPAFGKTDRAQEFTSAHWDSALLLWGRGKAETPGCTSVKMPELGSSFQSTLWKGD